MRHSVNSRLLSSYRRASQVASAIVIAIGFLVLLGWLFEIPALKSMPPGLATMKANTALAFMLAGISLWLTSAKQENQRLDRIARACAILTALIGLLTISEYIFSQNLGIDQLLFKDKLTPESAYPGRMSPVTALNLCLLGFGLLFLGSHRYRRLVEVFTIAALLISVVVLMGHIYEVPSLYQFFSYADIAIHTAFAFSILCLGILFARPEQGLMNVFSSENLGGTMARRLLPAALVLPFLLGWLFLTGQRMGLYDSTMSLVLFALSNVIVFAILILANARLLQRSDLVRLQAQTQLNQSEERKASILDTSPDGIITIDHMGRVLEFNSAAQKIFGYAEAEVLGREMSQLIIPPSLREQHRKGLANYLATGEGPVLGKRIEMTGMRADGTEFPVELTITLIEGGELPVFTGFVQDITERKRAEEQIAYQAYLLENVNDAVIGRDENSVIRFWNQGAERMFGWKAEEVLGRSGREILRSEFLNTDRETVLKVLAEHGRWKGETIQYRKDGTEVFIEASSITLRNADNSIAGYVSVHRDISERKLSDEELRKDTARTQALADISGTLAAVHLDYQNVLDTIARRMVELIGDLCNIHLLSEDKQWFDLAAVYHPDPEALAFFREMFMATRSRVDEGLSGRVIQTGQALLLAVTSPEQIKATINKRYWPLLERFPVHSILVAPLRAQGSVLGVLSMIRTQPGRPYNSEDQAFLQDLADRAALAIANTRLYAAMQQLNAELEQRVVERTAALSQANSLLQMLLDYMPDHIYFKDAQSRFIRNSRSQAKALGLSDPAEVVGKSDFDFFPHAQLSYEKEQEIIRSGNPLIDLEEQVVWPDSRKTWISTTKVPLFDQAGQIIGTFGISRDITDRKQAEVALQKAKIELEAANKELEAFSYSVSHDLRAPLRSIDGFSQALLEDYSELLPSEGRNFLERVRSSAQRMAELIDDLLNLSKVTRASMKLVSVDLSQLAQGIAAELQRTHAERRMSFNITPKLKVYGDPNLLQIVLENLLNNAWKFTSKREQAKIEFGSKHENAETIYFVRDNGAGFDMSYASKLFGAFQRLHAMTEFPGTGIGLATVQRIINRHGGRIWAEGAVGQGATFFFTLPALERSKPKEKDSLTKRVKEII